MGGQRLRSREGGRGRELVMERLWPPGLSRSSCDSRRGEGPLGPIRLAQAELAPLAPPWVRSQHT